MPTSSITVLSPEEQKRLVDGILSEVQSLRYSVETSVSTCLGTKWGGSILTGMTESIANAVRRGFQDSRGYSYFESFLARVAGDIKAHLAAQSKTPTE